MLNVGRLNEGVVLDHIEAGKSMSIYKYLKLDKMDCCVAIIKNAHRNKMGKKDIIKVECPIDELDLTRSGDMITLRIRGNGFLYNMVRIITGTLLRVGGGMIAPEEIPDILAAKDRGRAGETAPPQGLRLVKIEYPEWEEKNR